MRVSRYSTFLQAWCNIASSDSDKQSSATAVPSCPNDSNQQLHPNRNLHGHCDNILLSREFWKSESTAKPITVLHTQVCLTALMAQVGAWVPAQSLTLTPVDAIFVRMGAKDDMMAGQSTFLVELAETAAALNRATPASLVALDELGRGTATSDGAAIAAAVLDYLSRKTQCRSGMLMSTSPLYVCIQFCTAVLCQ